MFRIIQNIGFFLLCILLVACGELPKPFAERAIQKFYIHDLFCKHRIGKVNVGEVSLHVVVWSKHRKEGLDAMTYFISELKQKVPIWKWAIYKDGTKVPSDCTHH